MNSAFNKIPGQERVKQTLKSFLSSKLIPHAILFTGIDGVGKDNAALQFAKTILSGQNSERTQKSSRSIDLLQEPYIKLIFPLPRGKNETDADSPTEKLSQDEMEIVREEINIKAINPFHKISIPKANSIKINSIRDIKRFLSMDYEEIGYRFILILDAHMMNEEAQNALLKNLEEPPENVIFILTTSVTSKLRSTILSRCWQINFDPLSEEDIVFVLANYFEVNHGSAVEVAPFAMGSAQYALNLIDLDFHKLKEKTISILRYSFGRKFNSAFDELNSVLSDQNSKNFSVVVGMIITWLNDIQRYKLGINKCFFKDHLDTIEKFNSKFPDVNLYNITTQLDKLSNLTRNNINPSLLSASLITELSSVVLNK